MAAGLGCFSGPSETLPQDWDPIVSLRPPAEDRPFGGMLLDPTGAGGGIDIVAVRFLVVNPVHKGHVSARLKWDARPPPTGW